LAVEGEEASELVQALVEVGGGGGGPRLLHVLVLGVGVRRHLDLGAYCDAVTLEELLPANRSTPLISIAARQPQS